MDDISYDLQAEQAVDNIVLVINAVTASVSDYIAAINADFPSMLLAHEQLSRIDNIRLSLAYLIL